ncbi:MAG: gliding motility-associated C-terminal domain-containing protein [Flavobacteriales bacterium]|nr:gliding motility-associated C-terminal domain-containing protein [Flavobacteriales bacterium]
MKTAIFVSLLFSIALTSIGKAQNSDCITAIPLCQDLYEQADAPISTGDIFEWTGVCNLNTEWGSVWYTFTVQQDGLLSFIITPGDLNADYDWALFDITFGGCEGIWEGGPSPEVSCNSWGTTFPPVGPTGISTAEGGTGNTNGPGDLNGPPFNADLPVTAGQTFALVVMNWSNSTQGYTIDFGGSTASLYDELPPVIVSAEINCANTELTITFSEPVVVSSVHEEDFGITGTGGTYGISDVAALSGNTATLDHTFILTLDEQIVVGGSYEIIITTLNGQVEDLCGNLGSGIFGFPVASPMTYNVEFTTACNGEGGGLEVTGITGGTAPYVLNVDGVAQPDLIVDDIDAGAYTLLLVDSEDCALEMEVEVPDNSISLIPADNDTISCIQPSTTLQGATVVPDQNVNWTWTTTDGNIVSGANSSSPLVNAEGTYNVVVTNPDNGCIASESTVVISDEEVTFDPELLRFPNIVSPNGDNRNEQWKPFLANAPEFDVLSLFSNYRIQIFDRWGGLVFESASQGWDASDVAAGTYYYVVSYATQCGDGASADLEGMVEVVK